MYRAIVLRAALAAAVVAGSTLAWVASAEAIPAFARRYGTSCQTCHTVYPNLTPFGEAFRRNGYRFPAGEDFDRSVDEPVELGQEVHEDLFPDELWPGEIPGSIPIAFLVRPSVTFSEEAAAGGHAHGAMPAVAGHDEGR